LETNTKIWKFSFQRVNELKITPCLRRRLELWWQIGGELSSQIGQSHKFKKFNGLKFLELRKKMGEP
jgi:hypothetical protein